MTLPRGRLCPPRGGMGGVCMGRLHASEAQGHPCSPDRTNPLHLPVTCPCVRVRVVFCVSGTLVVAWLFCMVSMWSFRCFSCDICEPHHSCPLSSVRLVPPETWARSLRWGRSPSDSAPGSMLRDRSVAWGASVS